ncbi:MAG: hypothetical protein E7B59_23765 [Enterobacteriaceae bacterium]|nr:hypothetical protein [Enterobacteriaceae bacterium]
MRKKAPSRVLFLWRTSNFCPDGHCFTPPGLVFNQQNYFDPRNYSKVAFPQAESIL